MDSEKTNNKKENIFDLTKITPVATQHEVKLQPDKIISADAQYKLLEKYEELPNEKWNKLEVGNHIRYLRKDGIFRKGGFYKASWVAQNGKNAGKPFIQLSSSMYNGNTWTVSHNDLDKIYIKTMKNNITNITNTNNTNNTNNYIDRISYLEKSVDQLKIDVLKSINEQKRILNLIKKLHNIKVT